MSIFNTIINSVKGFYKYLQGIEAGRLLSMRDFFGDECALCNTKIEYKYFIEVDDCPIPTCKACKNMGRGGMTWSTIIKNRHQNKNRKYSSKYLRISVWLSNCDCD